MILNQGAYYLLAFAAIGTLLSASIFIPNKDGALSEVALAVKKKASLLVLLWFITAFLVILFKVSEILGTSIFSSFDSQTLTSYLIQTDLGKSMFIQIVVIAIVLTALPFIKRALPLLLFTLLAIVGLTSPVFQSHAAAGGSHSLAIGALVVHVVAISLWVGSLFGILIIPRDLRITALSHDRYFLERVCDRFVGLLGDLQLRDMPRGVDEYLELRRASLASSSANTTKGKSSTAAEERQLKKDLARVEKQLTKIRAELSELQLEQSAPDIAAERFLEISEKLAKLNQDLDMREEEWLSVTEKLEL